MTDDQPPPDDEQPEQEEPEQEEPEQEEPDEEEPDEEEPEGCPILDLNLGPLDLNLLGLRVELNETDLDITAEPGEGNLLGNLLCAVAGLLDGVDLSGILGDLLQRLLDSLIELLEGIGDGDGDGDGDGENGDGDAEAGENDDGDAEAGENDDGDAETGDDGDEAQPS